MPRKVRHDKMVDKLHRMGATRIVIDGDRLEVEFPERQQQYGDLRVVDGGRDMTDAEREAEELRMALYSTDEGV